MANPTIRWNAKQGKVIEGTSIATRGPSGRWEVSNRNAITKIGGQSKLYNVRSLDNPGRSGERWVVKIYNHDLSNDTKAFRKLVEISCKIIQHPHAHIYPIREGIEFRGDDRLYFAEVMPLCTGGNLHEHYRQLRSDELYLPEVIAQTECAIRQVGEALDHSHSELQWAHCDVRAVNILIRDKENFDCALADFGIAKEGEQRPIQFLKSGRQVTQVRDGYGSPELLLSTAWRVRKPGDFFLLGLTLLDLYNLLPGPDDPVDLGIKVLSGSFLDEINLLPGRLRTLALSLLNGCELGRASWVQIQAFAKHHVSRSAALSHLLQPSLFEEDPSTVRPYAIALHIARNPQSWFDRRTEFISAIRRWLRNAEGRVADTNAIWQAYEEISEKGYADSGDVATIPFRVALLLDNTIPLRVGEVEIYSLLELCELLDGHLADAAVRPVDFSVVAALLEAGILQEWIARVRPLPSPEDDHLTSDDERADCLHNLKTCLAAIRAWENEQGTTVATDNPQNGDVLRWLALRHCVMAGEPFRPPEILPPEVLRRFTEEDGGEAIFTWLLAEQLDSLDRWRRFGWLSIWHDAKSLSETGTSSPYGLASLHAGAASDLAATTLLAIYLGAQGGPKMRVRDLSVPALQDTFWGIVRHGESARREIRLFNEGIGVLAGSVQIREEFGNPKFSVAEIRSNDREKVEAGRFASPLPPSSELAVLHPFNVSHCRPFVGNDLIVVIALDPGVCAIRDAFSADIEIRWNQGGIAPALSDPPNYPVLSRYYSAGINMKRIAWHAGVKFLVGGGLMLVIGLLTLLVMQTSDELSAWSRPRTAEDAFWVSWGDWHPLGPFVSGGDMSKGFYGLCLTGSLAMLLLGFAIYKAVFAHRRKE